jgi:hypothetical protein
MHQADEPLHKITVNIYEKDWIRLRRDYGYGWSEQMRIIIRRFFRERDRASDEMRGIG